jgi:hypothetical protein
MLKPVLLFLFLGAAALSTLRAGADQPVPPVGEIEVQVHRDQGLVRVNIDLAVDASQEEAWNVLTDYDLMPAFVPTLKSSVVTRRAGNRLEVAQEGSATRGPWSFRFANVREVELTPLREIRSRIVSGDLSPGEVVTVLESAGDLTRVTVRGVYTPTMWVPPLLGPALIEAETREQWQILRREIMQRRAGG